MSDEKICFPVDVFSALVAVVGPLIDVEQKATEAVKSFTLMKEVDNIPTKVWETHIDLTLALTKSQLIGQEIPNELLHEVVEIIKDYQGQYLTNKKGEHDAT